MGDYMAKMKLVKKRRFKYRILFYLFLVFIGYQISYNIIMNFKLVKSNEDFVKALISDSNYHLLYEKKASNLFSQMFSRVLNINKPLSILEASLPFTQKEEAMTYVSNPNFSEVNDLKANPTVYIYNSHQSEEYQGEALENYNIKPGVMMASYIMQDKLAENDVKALVMEDNLVDYMNLNNMSYNKSYQAARNLITETIQNTPTLKLIIDLHRDALSKDKSTTIINNKSCAKIIFVIGKENSNYQSNLDMTNKINDKIKAKYPELTRGVIGKEGSGNNGIYNQDLSPKMTLLEIGGQENTIDEVLNTIELIAPIIGEYINEN